MTEFKTIKKKTEYPTDLSFVKNHLNVEDDFKNDDVYILSLIKAATGKAENYTGTDIALTANRKKYLKFEGDSLKVRETPLKSFTSIHVVDESGNTVELSPSSYSIIEKDTSFTVCFGGKVSYDEMELEFTTGYDADDCPFEITQAVCVKVADLYDIGRNSLTVGANYRDNEIFESLLNAHLVYYW